MAKDKEIAALQTTALAQLNEKEILFLKEVQLPLSNQTKNKFCF
jgi:hypothetical protein